jgi:hypothetical protein
MATEKIEREVQLLVEGNDERNFFRTFIERLQLANVQVQVLDGKDRLRDSLETLAGTTDFRIVRSIGIVRDADDSAPKAFQSVQTSLRNVNQVVRTWSGVEFPVPERPEERAGDVPSVSVLILPVGGEQGMLETLLCRTFAGTDVDRCIDGFFQCAEESGSPIHRPDKARARAYLTTKPHPHVSVGVAAQKGYWDFDHDAFDGVRRFLRLLAQNLSPA